MLKQLINNHDRHFENILCKESLVLFIIVEAKTTVFICALRGKLPINCKIMKLIILSLLEFNFLDHFSSGIELFCWFLYSTAAHVHTYGLSAYSIWLLNVCFGDLWWIDQDHSLWSYTEYLTSFIKKLRFPISVLNKMCMSGQSGKCKQQREADMFSLLEVMFL